MPRRPSAVAARPERPYRGSSPAASDDCRSIADRATASLAAATTTTSWLDQPTEQRSIPRSARAADGRGSSPARLSYSLDTAVASASAPSAGTSSALLPARLAGRSLEQLQREHRRHVPVAAHARRSRCSQSVALPAVHVPVRVFPMLDEPLLGASETPPVGFRHRLATPYLSLTGGVGLSQQALSRADHVHGGYNYQRQRDAYVERQSLAAAGGMRVLSRTHARPRACALGYALSAEAALRATDHATYHNIDVGLDFQQALSLLAPDDVWPSRTGTAAAVADSGSTQLPRDRQRARLNHEIGRTWLAAAAYDRGRTVRRDAAGSRSSATRSAAASAAWSIGACSSGRASAARSARSDSSEHARQRFDTVSGAVAALRCASRLHERRRELRLLPATASTRHRRARARRRRRTSTGRASARTSASGRRCSTERGEANASR